MEIETSMEAGEVISNKMIGEVSTVNANNPNASCVSELELTVPSDAALTTPTKALTASKEVKETALRCHDQIRHYNHLRIRLLHNFFFNLHVAVVITLTIVA